MATKRKESEVWVYFNILIDMPHLARCSLCQTKISRGKPDSAPKAYSVKGLWDHLNSKHKAEYKIAKTAQEEFAAKKKKLDDETIAAKSRLYQLEQSQPSLKDLMGRNQKWSSDFPNQIEAEKTLLNWIFDDLQPYTVVENHQFQGFVYSLNRKFNIPSEKVIRCTLMPKLYRETQGALQNSLSVTLKENYFSITCDIWSSLALDSYLGVTVHFITKEFDRKVIVIRCLPYNASHTGESIKTRVTYVLEKWQLSLDKLHCVVSDSAANMKKAFEEWDWLACFLHILALVVKHSIFEQSGVNRLIKKVKKLIIKLRTPTGKRILNEHQSSETALITPCDTRWNSYYLMLQCVSSKKTAITLSQQQPELNLDAGQQISPGDWELIDKVMAILKPIFYTTKAAESDSVSIAEVIPLLKKLNFEIGAVTYSGIGTLKSEVLQHIKRYFVVKYDIEKTKHYSIATVLDPRFKLAGFQKKENGVLAKELIIRELAQIVSEVVETPVVEPQNVPSTSKDSWASVLVDDDSDQLSQDEEAEAPYRTELQRYLKEKRVSDLNADPLLYWKVKAAEFPHLGSMVRQYLCPPPGSAASERMFSTGKNVLGTNRLRLKPVNMEANLFLKYNIRALGYKTVLPPLSKEYVAPNDGNLPEAVATEDVETEEDPAISISDDED